MAIPITELVLVHGVSWIAAGDSPARFEGSMEIYRHLEGDDRELIWCGKTTVYDSEIEARHAAQAEGEAKRELLAATLD